MIKNERQQEILDILKEMGYVSVEELAKLTYSSTPTIRRDLNYLQEKGYLTRNHGGAILPLNPTSFIPSDLRTKLHANQKKLLCKEASKELFDNCVVFINESSTVQHLAEYLKDFKDVTVITNSLTLCNKLTQYNVKFYCTGGQITHSNCFTGAHAERFIRRFNADLCFFSSHGITKDGTITGNIENEALITSAMLEQSKKAIYLCDDSKVGLLANYNLANANTVDKIYTTALPEVFEIEDKSNVIHVQVSKLDE